MKTVCVYHSVDLDGWMSAAIVKKWFFEKTPDPKMTGIDLDKYKGVMEGAESAGNWNVLDFCGFNYGQPVPCLSGYDWVIMCDISFPAMDMINLDTKLTWIDHHVSAIKDVDIAIRNNASLGAAELNGLRDVKFAACELTWKYLFPDESMPEIVRLLGRYDCFGHKGTDEERYVLEFQYGARASISNYDEAYSRLTKSILDQQKNNPFYVENAIHDNGVAIYKYLCQEAKQIYTTKFDLVFYKQTQESGDLLNNTPSIYKFAAINRERFNPINFGIDYHAGGYDGVACFYRRSDGKWTFSLYNDNGNVDCSVIAKTFGGGGHKGASGFVVEDINSILNK